VSGNLGNRIFFGLGSDGITCYSDWWEYNLTANYWEKRPDFPGSPRKEAVLVPWGNQLFVGLGIDSSETIGFHDWYSFEAIGQTWTRLADFPGQNIQYGAAMGFMDRVLCLTGMNENKQFYNESYFYKPSLNEWFALGGLPFSPRKGVSSLNQGNTLFIVAGIDLSYQRRTEVWQGKYSPTEPSLSFFPNPIQNELVIQSSLPVTAQIRLLNLQGLEMLETSFHHQNWPKLNFQPLPAGFYFLEYETNQFKKVVKILKAN
jgi:N-acetylneuraminic acid mutarotase